MTSQLADAILVVHCAFIVFVVGGEACIVVGKFRGWSWVHNFNFRIWHLLAILFVIVQNWASQICPLTVWENALRNTAGEQSYSETFIEHWVGRLVYHAAPDWVFTATYSTFGALVILSWIWVRPRK
ncbi:MAG: DUF2784 domain-containing protein [Desulfuromonas sp.]|nr:MAG: DUF2784 domain-containing protein [Desulfuromonas sp.]